MEPYQTIDELPKALRRELPELAQRLYLAVYQRVWETTAMSGEMQEETLAQTAHKAGMLEVERRFDRDDAGNWVQAPVGEEIDRDKLEGTAPDVDDD